jgi:hypothetical protein
MNRHFLLISALVLAVCSVATGWAQQAPASGTQARMLVTVEPHHGSDVPLIKQDDVLVYEGKDRDQVTEWTPATGDNGALELFILIDDSSSTSLGSQLEDIKQFINAQPATTLVGVAYMQDGVARVVQNLTNDHAAAAKALRLPLGLAGAEASPYDSISDLVKKWPASKARHEAFMVSDGVDRLYGSGDIQDPYLEAAISDAVRAGIVVSAVYTPGVGHFGHSYWQNHWGQLYLSELADKTGGEAYYIGFTGSPVTFAPYLDQFAHRLQHQYWLGFVPKPPKKSGLVSIRLRSEVQGVDLVSAGRVYVSAER